MNTYEMLGRERKAAKIAELMRADGIEANFAEKCLTVEDWQIYASAAGVKMPSADTKALVISMLKGTNSA